MQIAFFRSKTAAEHPASQKGASKIRREFRLCKRLSFVVYRLHSTQQMRKLCQKIGEHSVHAAHSKHRGSQCSSTGFHDIAEASMTSQNTWAAEEGVGGMASATKLSCDHAVPHYRGNPISNGEWMKM